MSKIRKLYYFDKKKTQEMISFLNNGTHDRYHSSVMFNPLVLLHHFLPLPLKFLPESYVLEDKNCIKGLITVSPMNYKRKIQIEKLFFEENGYLDAAELIQFVVSKYKKLGALSVVVKVNDYMPKLLDVFINKCNFTQISNEKLWRIGKFINRNFDKKIYRPFRNSDAKDIANLYNDSLMPHFRPLLSKTAKEFYEPFFQGLSYISEYKYIVEDTVTKNTVGYISIQTSDNVNYLIDIIQENGIDINIEEVISFATSQIKKRKKRFGFFIKSKNYTIFGEKYDKIFAENKFEQVQNQIVLTNSSAKLLKENIKPRRYTILDDFCPSGIVQT